MNHSHQVLAARIVAIVGSLIAYAIANAEALRLSGVVAWLGLIGFLLTLIAGYLPRPIGASGDGTDSDSDNT